MLELLRGVPERKSVVDWYYMGAKIIDKSQDNRLLNII